MPGNGSSCEGSSSSARRGEWLLDAASKRRQPAGPATPCVVQPRSMFSTEAGEKCSWGPHRCTLAELNAKQRHHGPKGAGELLVVQSIQAEHGRAHNIRDLQHGHLPLKRQLDETRPAGGLHCCHSCRPAMWTLSAASCMRAHCGAHCRGHKAPLGAEPAHSSRHRQLGLLPAKGGSLQSPK